MHSRLKALIVVLTVFAMGAVGLTACGDDDGQQNQNNTGVDAGPGDDGGPGDDSGPGDDAGPGADAGPVANAGSPLGTNLTGIADWSREWPFVNAFKASRAWISGSSGEWDDGRTLDLDARGWVQSLQSGQIARTLLFWDTGDTYPAGRYVVLYDGEGTIDYWSSATLDAGASTPGRDVIDVDPTQGGIGMNLTATTAGDPLRNIRVIMPGGACAEDRFRWCDDATPCASGACLAFEDHYATQIFHPIFLDRTKTYSTVRFMDWMDTNNSAQQLWADRPHPDDARWSIKGVPVEIMVALANRLHMDPWFTLPHLADDDYVTHFATAVQGLLDPDLLIYVEHSNEVWNGIFSQAAYCEQQGLALGLSTDAYQAQLFYHSQRSVEMFQLFETVFGGTSRLVRVMGSQAANSWVSEQVLDYGDAPTNTDALGIAPYFGGYLGGPSEQTRVEAMSVGELMTELGDTALPTALGWITAQAAIADARGVSLVAYEAGQHLAGHGGVESNAVINALFDDANRDPLMGTLYTQYLEGWRDNGGALLAHFVNCSGWGRYGRWGALETMEQPRSESPKFDALQSFIENNLPWW